MPNPAYALMSRPKKELYFIFVIVCAATSVVWAPAQLWTLWRIASAPVAASGVVTRLNCADHSRVDYTFQADGATVVSTTRGIDGIDCRDVRVGQSVSVTYARGAPQNSYAVPAGVGGDSPWRVFGWAVLGLVSFVVLEPLFLVVVAKIAVRVMRRWRPAT